MTRKTLLLVVALGISILMLLRYSVEKPDTPSEAAAIVLPEPSASNKAERELPSQVNPPIPVTLDPKRGLQTHMGELEREVAHGQRSAFATSVDKTLLSPQMLDRLHVQFDLTVTLSESLAPALLRAKSEDEQAGYFNEVISSLDQHVRAVDQEVIRLEGLVIEELEHAKVQDKLKREAETREKYATRTVLAENAVVKVPFSFGSGWHAIPGVKSKGEIEDLRRHRDRILKVARGHMERYSQIIRKTPSIQEIPVTKELFPE